jgi:hypothetical protein
MEREADGQRTGLPDFSWYNKPKRGKIYQMTTKCNKWPLNLPIGSKIYHHIPIQDPQKFTQNVFFWFENKPSGNPDNKRGKVLCLQVIFSAGLPDFSLSKHTKTEKYTK